MLWGLVMTEKYKPGTDIPIDSRISMIPNYIARRLIDIPLRSPGASPILEGHS